MIAKIHNKLLNTTIIIALCAFSSAYVTYTLFNYFNKNTNFSYEDLFKIIVYFGFFILGFGVIIRIASFLITHYGTYYKKIYDNFLFKKHNIAYSFNYHIENYSINDQSVFLLGVTLFKNNSQCVINCDPKEYLIKNNEFKMFCYLNKIKESEGEKIINHLNFIIKTDFQESKKNQN